jgi:translation initiation factor IF-3
MDFGKYLYEQEKKERAAKKHQKVITVKEVKFRINVDEHDYEFKKNHVLRFLEDGDKVKATIFFRGREMTHTNLGRQILERLIKDIADKGVVEFRPRMEGNTLHAILAPKKTG